MDQKSIEMVLERLLDKKLNPMSSLNEIKLNMNQVEDSVAFLSNKYDDLSVQMKEIKLKHETLQQENKLLRSEVQRFTNDINHMREELNRQEQYSRRECLEISGIPFQESENANDIVIEIG